MRLINADKLRHELIMGHDLIGAKYTDMADTVKAIPIEWLKAKVKQHYDEGAYQTASAFQWIIDMWNEDEKDWEKENETN